jgi:hypothetical protein
MTATLAPAPRPAVAQLPGTRMLTPTEQLERRPLAAWSADLLQEMRTDRVRWYGETVDERVRVFVSWGNLIGLIHTHAGRPDNALLVCEAQVAWLAALADRSGRPELFTHAVQPWCNLGRLHALAGRTDDALRHYADVYACCTVPGTPLAGREIDPGWWDRALWAPGSVQSLGRTLLVMDSLRVLLPAARWQAVLDLAAGGVADGTALLPVVLREAEMVALARTGDAEQAIAAAERARGEGRAWDRIVATLRWAELAALSGDEERATRAAVELLSVARRVSVADKLELPVLFPLQQLAAFAFSLGLAREAVELGEALLAGARRLDDEVMQIEVLRQLSAHAPDADARDAHAETLAAMVDATAYARLRPRNDPPQVPEDADAVLDLILSLMPAA